MAENLVSCYQCVFSSCIGSLFCFREEMHISVLCFPVLWFALHWFTFMRLQMYTCCLSFHSVFCKEVLLCKTEYMVFVLLHWLLSLSIVVFIWDYFLANGKISFLCGLVVFHQIGVLQSPYPFLCWQAPGLIPYLLQCELCYYKYRIADCSLECSWLFCTYLQKCESWVIWEINYQLSVYSP